METHEIFGGSSAPKPAGRRREPEGAFSEEELPSDIVLYTREVVEYFHDRFGIERDWFEPYVFTKRRNTVFLLGRSNHIEKAFSLRIDSPGLPVLRRVGAYLKPTGYMVQLLGRLARKNVLDLSFRDLLSLAQGTPMGVDDTVSDGYVILRTGDLVAGCGLVVENRLLGQFPGWFRAALRPEGTLGG
jgi:hypothetical protein